MTDFDKALALVLREEGGCVDDARDAGGRTAHGVTQRTFNAWQDAHGLVRRDVWTISAAEESAIYRNQYANHIRFDDLPNGVAYCVLDDAVNSGPIEAVRELQIVLGAEPDGVLGDITIAKLRGVIDVGALIDRLCDARLTFLRRLKAFATFGRGWSNRVAFVRTQAKAWPTEPLDIRPTIEARMINAVHEMLR